MVGVLGAWWSFTATGDRATPEHFLAAQPDQQKVSINLKGRTIQVEVVNTPASITQGLSGRSEMGADGMLFVFSTARQTSFWMKEMRFDIDMVWIHDGKIVGITAAVPAPDPQTPLNQLPTYPSPQAVDMVLELPAGTAQDWDLALGDQIGL